MIARAVLVGTVLRAVIVAALVTVLVVACSPHHAGARAIPVDTGQALAYDRCTFSAWTARTSPVPCWRLLPPIGATR